MMSKANPDKADTAADSGQPVLSGWRPVPPAIAFRSAQTRMQDVVVCILPQDFVTEMGRGLVS